MPDRSVPQVLLKHPHGRRTTGQADRTQRRELTDTGKGATTRAPTNVSVEATSVAGSRLYSAANIAPHGVKGGPHREHGQRLDRGTRYTDPRAEIAAQAVRRPGRELVDPRRHQVGGLRIDDCGPGDDTQ